MKLNDKQVAKMTELGIPGYMQGGIIRYIENGIPPGHFLSAVINNSLKDAVDRADDNNVSKLPNYVQWFYNYAPSNCWGYEGATDDWYRKIEAEKITDAVIDVVQDIAGELK